MTLITGISKQAGDSRYAMRLQPGGVFFAGDSIMQHDNINGLDPSVTAGAVVFGPLSWPGQALLQTAGRYRFAGVGATNGFTSAQILATEIPIAIAANPAVCVILAGTNDGPLGIAAFIANIQAMVAQLQAAGIQPVLCTVPPQGVVPVLLVSQQNAWLRKWTRDNGVPCVDLHQALVDPTTGGWIAAYANADGVHPIAAGTAVMGQILAATLNALPAEPKPAQLLGGYDSNMLLKDVCFEGSGGGTTWSVAGSGTFPASTGAGWKGNKIAVTSGGAGNNEFCIAALNGGAALTAGHRIAVACLLDVTAMPAGATWSAMLYDATAASPVLGYNGMTQLVPVGSVMSFETVLQADQVTHALTLQFSVQGAAAGVMSFAQATVLDLTALGAA